MLINGDVINILQVVHPLSVKVSSKIGQRDFQGKINTLCRC